MSKPRILDYFDFLLILTIEGLETPQVEFFESFQKKKTNVRAQEIRFLGDSIELDYLPS